MLNLERVQSNRDLTPHYQTHISKDSGDLQIGHSSAGSLCVAADVTVYRAAGTLTTQDAFLTGQVWT